MTQSIERKRLPPIVPKKNPQLAHRNSSQSTTTILIGNIKPRVDNEETENKPDDARYEATMKSLVDSITLNTEYDVAKPSKHEPKIIKFDDVAKRVVRTDIHIPHRLHMNTEPEMKPKPKPVLKPKPSLKPKPELTMKQHLQSKPKPEVKPKPALKPKPHTDTDTDTDTFKGTFKGTINPKDDDIPPFLRETLQKRLQLQKSFTTSSSSSPVLQSRNSSRDIHSFPASIPAPIALPGMAKPGASYAPRKSHSVNVAQLSNKPFQPLTHPTKRRAKGPKRKLPQSISTDSSSTSTRSSSITSLAIHKHTVSKPPVPPKKPQLCK